MEKGTLKPETELDALDMWDSVGKLFLLSMLKKDFALDLEPKVIRQFKTVSEILKVMGAD
jgi:acyl carrier protein